MAKTKIIVRNVINTGNDFDVVYAEINSGDSTRNIQICMPKYCDMPSLIGKEVYYEIKNGFVQVTPVKQRKKTAETNENTTLDTEE